MNGIDYIADTNAIIAATAISYQLPLITADAGFFNISGLRVEKILP